MYYSKPMPPHALALEPAVCPLCAVEDADPVAVGADFEYRTSPDEFLAVRCRRCRVIYLNPRPAPSEAGRIYPDEYHAFAFAPAEYGLAYRVRRRLDARRLLKWCRGLPADARVLDVGCGDGFHLALLRDYGVNTWTLAGCDPDGRAVAAAGRAGFDVVHGPAAAVPDSPGFDLVLLVMTVEHLADPVGVVRQIAARLNPGGRLVVVTDNAASPDFAVFGGRHWGGYHFPRHFTLFTRPTLAALATAAGLDVVRVTTAVSPVNWTYSVRNLVVDWGGPGRPWGWLARRLTLAAAPALAAFTLLDLACAAVGCGAVLHGTFAKPAAGPAGGAR